MHARPPPLSAEERGSLVLETCAPHDAQMVKITAVYEKGLRCRANHGPSGNELLTDAPADNHGKGEAFSPTDLVATALATCIMTTMGIVAERAGIDLGGISAEIEKHMTTAPVRRIGKLVTRFVVPVKLDEEWQTRLERVAHTCPVHQSLHPDVELEISFDWKS